MAISYSAPTVRAVVDFTAEDVVDSIDYWKYALIGTVVGARIPVEAMKRFVTARWNMSPQIHVADGGVFVFRFQSEEEQLDVFGGGPWMIKGVYPLLLKQWSPGVSLDPGSIVDYPVWVQLPNLDLQFGPLLCKVGLLVIWANIAILTNLQLIRIE